MSLMKLRRLFEVFSKKLHISIDHSLPTRPHVVVCARVTEVGRVDWIKGEVGDC